MPELLNTPDRDEIKSLHQYLKHQQQHNHQHHHQPITNKLTSIINNPENRKLLDLHQISSPASSTRAKATFSTPESSQTDSDDVSPQIQRNYLTIILIAFRNVSLIINYYHY